MNANTRHLLSISTGHLHTCDTDEANIHMHNHAYPSELIEMLVCKNGFYAFENSLHVRPIKSPEPRRGIHEWNDPALWINSYEGMAGGRLFFAEDVFGNQYSIADSEIEYFEAETGTFQLVADSLDEWSEYILSEYNVAVGHPIAHEWQKLNGPLLPGTRLVPRIPFVCGGEFTVDNLYATSDVDGMLFRANLAIQIRDLPDGSSIRFRIEE